MRGGLGGRHVLRLGQRLLLCLDHGRDLVPEDAGAQSLALLFRQVWPIELEEEVEGHLAGELVGTGTTASTTRHGGSGGVSQAGKLVRPFRRIVLLEESIVRAAVEHQQQLLGRDE